VPPPPPLPSPSAGDASKKLVNVSTRADVGTGDGVMIGGFIITGNADKRVVLRALGPSLSQFGVSGALTDPILDLYDSAGILVESNDNWTAIPGLANRLQPRNPSESLLTAILPAGSYTAICRRHGSDTGNRSIVRALGPSLAALGVPTPLPNPYLELHDSNGALQ
jgi:hypothetical protein